MFLTIFSLLTLLSALLVILNTNLIISLLFLIALFVNASITLIFFGFDFFGLIFIAIYAGAIAVLFLFIVMMINIPYTLISKHILYELCVLSFFLVLLFLLLNIFSKSSIILPNTLYSTLLILFNHNYTESLELISAILYTHYGFYVLFAGILLFLAMISSIMIFAEYQFNYSVYSKE